LPVYIHVAQTEDMAMKTYPTRGLRASSLNPELDILVHPARAFARPQDIVSDPDLTLNEKTSILSSWACDACAVEATPALRRPPGSDRPISVEAILEALRDLDKTATHVSPTVQVRRQIGRRSIEALRRLRHRRVNNSGNSASHRSQQAFEGKDMTDLDTILITAHRGNIRRYQRLLRTHMTNLERSFVLRRIEEERSAIRDLQQKRAKRQAPPFPEHVGAEIQPPARAERHTDWAQGLA
jgi:hypothetical protein